MKNKAQKTTFFYENTERIRIDVLLSEGFPDFTRSHYKTMILNGQVLVNGRRIKPNFLVSSGDEISVEKQPPKPVDVKPENIPLDIVYEDNDIIVINKARGMVVHPAPGHESGTLVNALLYHATHLSGINGELRPGIVHRIDKDTTGLMVAAKNDAAHVSLASQIEHKEAHRIYQALVHGGFKDESGTVDAPVGRHRTDRKMMAVVPNGREARTHYRVLKAYEGYTLLELKLDTGRTHQIRVHMKYIGHPVACDSVYGVKHEKLGFDKQLLHAESLTITHPKTGKSMTFHAPLPDDFQAILKKLKPKT